MVLVLGKHMQEIKKEVILVIHYHQLIIYKSKVLGWDLL